MWKRPPTKRGRVEFADEGRGREASSLSVFVLGYVWPLVPPPKNSQHVAGKACHKGLACSAAMLAARLERQPHIHIGAPVQLVPRAD